MLRLPLWCRSICVLVIAAISVFGFSSTVRADNVNVVIGVGDTTVLFTGTTSPNALVTFMESGTMIGSTTANVNGNYSKLLTDQTAGIHTYQIGAQDTAGRLTDTISIVSNVVEHAQTTIMAFLPPTIELSSYQFTPTETISMKGATAPLASVIIYIDNSTYQTVAANLNGEWEYSFSAASLESGAHQLYVVASKAGVGQSYPTQTRDFVLLTSVEARPQGGGGSEPPSSSTQPSSRPQVPIIIEPQPGQVIGEDIVDVVGTSQPGVQIEVWNRGQIIGSVFADGRGNWRLTLSLKEFINEVKARACNSAGTCSAFSNIVQFFYQAPATGSGPEIKLNRYRWQTMVDEGIGILATVRGGDTPYVLLVEWGDGTRDTFRTAGPTVLLTHAYRKAGKYSGKAILTDEQGRKAVAQFSVEVMARKFVFPWYWFFWWLTLLLCVLLLLVWIIHHRKVSRQKSDLTVNKRKHTLK